MLNPLLYNKLKQIFGDVGISRENEIGEIVRPQGGGVHQVIHGERYLVECPDCEDEHKKRLGISYLSGQTVKLPERKHPIAFSYNFRCVHKECQRGQNLWRFLKDSGIWDLGIVHLEEAEGVKIQAAKSFANKPVIQIPKVAKPVNAPAVPEHVIEYIRERGFDPDELVTEFDIKWMPAGSSWKIPKEIQEKRNDDRKEIKFHYEKLVIPLIARRKLIGWQMRAVSEDDPIRYYTAPETDLVSMLYNMDQAKFSRGVIITEGATDAWKASKVFEYRDKSGEKVKPVNAVALFGKGFSKERLRIISNLWGSELDWGCLMLDSTQEDKSIGETAGKIAQDLRDHHAFPAGFSIAYLDSGDPGDHSVKELEDAVNESEQWW